MEKCFICSKALGMFSSKRSYKMLVSQMRQIPIGMTENDFVCNDCANNLGSQSYPVSMTGQIILVLIPFAHFILQPIAFWRIKKLRKFLLYFLTVIGVSIALTSLGSVLKIELLTYIGLFELFADFILPVIWIHDWTKKYNASLQKL